MFEIKMLLSFIMSFACVATFRKPFHSNLVWLFAVMLFIVCVCVFGVSFRCTHTLLFHIAHQNKTKNNCSKSFKVAQFVRRTSCNVQSKNRTNGMFHGQFNQTARINQLQIVYESMFVSVV